MKIYEYVIKIKDQGIDKLRQLAGTGTSIRNAFGMVGRSITGFGRQLSSVGGQILSFMGLNSALVRTLGPAALIAGFAFLGKQAVSLAADLEQTTVGFEVMLGSAEKANEMVANLRQFAKVTPFETTDLVKATEILLGFGVAGDQIMPTIKMLGDVSRGSADKLRLVSLAYAQIQAAGRLMGQDLLQLVNAGFNPLQQISAKTGKSMAVLKKEMEDGKISAAMVTQAFRDATSQGGRFFGMMDRQSRTFSGLASTLHDEWSTALLDIGTRLLPTATEAVRGLSSVLHDLTGRVDFGPLMLAFSDTWHLISQTRDILAELFQKMGMNTSQANLLQFAFNALAFSLRAGFFPLRLLLTGFTLLVDVIKSSITVGKAFGLMMEGIITGNVGLMKIGFEELTDSFSKGFANIKKQIVDFAKSEKEGFSGIFNTGPKAVNQLANAAGTNGAKTGGAKAGDAKLKDGIDKITGGGRQAVNVTINLQNLVGVQNFDVTNVKESVQDIKKKVTEALLETLNSANYAASQ